MMVEFVELYSAAKRFVKKKIENLDSSHWLVKVYMYAPNMNNKKREKKSIQHAFWLSFLALIFFPTPYSIGQCTLYIINF